MTSGNVELLKETENIIEDENDKQVLTSTGGTLKNTEMLRDENDKHIRTSTGEPLKNEEMFRDEKLKHVHTYDVLVSIEKLSNERER